MTLALVVRVRNLKSAAKIFPRRKKFQHKSYRQITLLLLQKKHQRFLVPSFKMSFNLNFQERKKVAKKSNAKKENKKCCL